MAFNFNWSPLAADADFYQRAQEMLTSALNKSPKPRIIVDDIFVNELNLGSLPPDLEISEIGDLAEDRFRGIFKMCYAGDAFLTLKTRVQANPLNTYLFSKPLFASPQPLAAASGLTIPIQITLSEIKLSGFIILVFSRQKGLTLVFRNDPLESIKVSSTFDSIPFVRDYLQKEIEKQLRNLMMDELPAIIHKLSLRLWCPEYKSQEDPQSIETTSAPEEVAIDPLASPPQDAVDARGNVLDASEISSLSLDGGLEIHSLFSQKNLLRLAALTDSHQTLSLFTPSIRDAVFRAWASPSERTDSPSPPIQTPSGLVRSHSALGGLYTTYSLSNRASEDGHGYLTSRSSQVSLTGATTGLHMGAGRHARQHGNRKKKNRIVNLRKSKATDDSTSETGDTETTTSADSVCESMEPSQKIAEEPEDFIFTPPQSPTGKVRFRASSIDIDSTPRKAKSSRPATVLAIDQANLVPVPSVEVGSSDTIPIHSRNHRPSFGASSQVLQRFNTAANTSAALSGPCKSPVPTLSLDGSPAVGSVLEQAWIMKLAGEIARQAHGEKNAKHAFWSTQLHSDREETPPPAYQAKA